MKYQISSESQGIIIYKINPNQQELNGEVDYDRNVHGRTLVGNLSIVNNILIIENNYQEVVGVFSLDHYYFLKVGNT